MTIIIIEDNRTMRYKIPIGRAHKYYYHYYHKYFGKEHADKERHIFKKKNRPYFERKHIFNSKFWKKHLLWNKANIDDSLYDIYLRFNIRINKL